MMAQVVGARIRQTMAERGFSIVTLADAAGYAPNTVWKYCHGTVNPKLVTVADIAKALGVSPGWLCFGEGVGSPPTQHQGDRLDAPTQRPENTCPDGFCRSRADHVAHATAPALRRQQ